MNKKIVSGLLIPTIAISNTANAFTPKERVHGKPDSLLSTFNSNYDRTKKIALSPDLYKGCKQVLENVVVTPHYLVSSCCGLTYEHIPEMKIGNLRTESILKAYTSQLDDFMKIWIRMKGPLNIAIEMMGKEYAEKHFAGANHICEVCSKLYKSPEIIDKIKIRYHDFIHEIMFRFASNLEIQKFTLEGNSK